MKKTLFALSFGMLAVTGASSASAGVSIDVGIGGCGYPAYYPTCPYYAPPVGVYLGGGNWGGDRGWHGGDRGHGGGRGGGGHEGGAHGGGRR